MKFSTFREEVLPCLYGPWELIIFSFRHIPLTVRNLIAEGDYATLFSFSGFREALFGTFWPLISPGIKDNCQPKIIPLFEGRMRDGEIHDEVVNSPIHGVVLEVGAGNGAWVDVLARFTHARDSSRGLRNRKSESPVITKIYGIEPNPISAKGLERRVQEVGIGDVYTVVPVGLESVNDPAAWNGKIEPGSVDCIVSILCMCSIPEPEKNIKLLYDLLKPGGHWYMYEHVKVKRGGPLLKLYQRFVNIPWSFFVGSCRLCRDTEQTIRNAGVWEDINLVPPPDHSYYDILPHIIGTAKK